MIKAVIFDFGGVVRKPGNRWISDIASRYGLPKKILIRKMQFSLKLFRKGFISENEFWKRFSSGLNKPVPKDKNNLWRRGYEKNFYIYPSIVKFVKKLKTGGIKTAILSNTIKPHTEIIKKKKGYKGFDVLVLSCKEGLQKPEPKIYRLTAKRLGVKPKECIFIDDRKENLEPAKELGMRTVLAVSPRQVIKEVSEIIK